MASGITIHIDGKPYELDDFELGDLEWLEEFIDAPLSDQQALNRMKTAVGFTYLVKRRDNPNFTIDDARKIKLSSIDAEPGDEAPKRPTGGARSKKSA